MLLDRLARQTGRAKPREMDDAADSGFLFDEKLELAERHVPLLRDQIQRAARLLQPAALQLPEAFLSPPAAAHQTRPGQHPQVLGDSLSSDARAHREPGDGHGPPAGQLGQEPEPVLVAQGGEDRRRSGRPRPAGQETSEG